MKKYWKTPQSELKNIKGLTSLQNTIWSEFCKEKGFIYICCNDNYTDPRYSYMPYEPYSIEYLNKEGFNYLGDYGVKGERKEKLKNIFLIDNF